MKHGNLLCDWVGEVHQNKWLAPDCQFPEFLPIPFSVPNMCKHAARIGEIINNQAKGTCTHPPTPLAAIPSDRLSSPTLHPFPASSSFLLLHVAAHTRFPLRILLLVTPSSLHYPNSLFFWPLL
jgi:hypothetical protein